MKRLLLLIAILLNIPVYAYNTRSVVEYDGESAKSAAQNDVLNWMKYLPDDVYVAHVSIPGTHDTATAEGWKSITGSNYSTTQEKNIDEQLAGGIRAFDFRPGMVDNVLWCNHGTDQTTLKLADAFTKLKNFLDAHPSEFFVMHLFRGNIFRSGEASTGNKILGAKDDSSSQNKYNQLFNELFNTGEFADYFIDYSPYLKVGEVRGKIIVFRRDRIDFAHVAKAGNLDNWPGSEENWTESNYVTVTNASDPTIKGIIRATDVSSPDNEEQLNIELNSISNLYNYNCNQILPNDAKREGNYKPYWSMIFTSGAYNGENTAGYKRNATYTNPHFTELIKNAEKKGPTGIVFSDWVLTDNYDAKGVELVPTIFLSNFDYINNYILDDELFSIADNESLWDESKEYFLRNVATGELLYSGGEWGTHAVTNKYGIRIKIKYDQDNRLYRLCTTQSNASQNSGGIGDNYFVDNDNPALFSVNREESGKFSFSFDNKVMTAVTHDENYADGTVYLVEGREYEKDNEYQQWEVISVDEYFKSQIAKASKDSGVDISYMIHAFRFLPNDSENEDAWIWTDTGGTSWGTYYSAERNFEGINIQTDKDLFFKGYNKKASGQSSHMKWTLTQKVENLPNGIYSLYANIANLAGSNFTFTVNGNKIEVNSIASSGTMAADEIITLFRNGEHKYGIEDLIVTDGSIEIHFEKAGTASETMVAIDNFELIYYGPETSSVLWTMEGSKYDTLILPFDAEVPENMEAFNVYATDGKEYTDYHVLSLVPADMILANTPYVVKYAETAENPVSPLSMRSAAVRNSAMPLDVNSYSFTGVPENDGDEYTEGLLTGTLKGKTLSAASNHYVLTHDSENSYFRQHSENSEVNISANHAYIAKESATDFSKSALQLEEPNRGENTGINEINANEIFVDVFSSTGVKVRSNVSIDNPLEGLEPSIYILSNGQHLLKTSR